MNERLILVLCTVPDQETARRLAGHLVESGLVACVNIVPGLESHYKWQGKKEVSFEYLLLIKTLDARFEELESVLQQMHPYDCPEIVSLASDQVSGSYLDWVKNSCS